MPSLTLTFKGRLLSECSLRQGTTWAIGRRESNDVVVDNMAVSGVQARIDLVENGYLLTDMKSRNGTYVNKSRISSCWLHNGDVITVGKHELVFVMEEDKHQQPAEPLDKTMVLDTSDFKEMLARNLAEDKVAVLSYVKGGDGEVPLAKRLIRIGKDAANDIQVRGCFVGRFALTINRQENSFQLNFVKGLAKPRVNGKKVKRSIQLKEFDTLEIGRAKLDFFFKPA